MTSHYGSLLSQKEALGYSISFLAKDIEKLSNQVRSLDSKLKQTADLLDVNKKEYQNLKEAKIVSIAELRSLKESTENLVERDEDIKIEYTIAIQNLETVKQQLKLSQSILRTIEEQINSLGQVVTLDDYR